MKCGDPDRKCLQAISQGISLEHPSTARHCHEAQSDTEDPIPLQIDRCLHTFVGKLQAFATSYRKICRNQVNDRQPSNVFSKRGSPTRPPGILPHPVSDTIEIARFYRSIVFGASIESTAFSAWPKVNIASPTCRPQSGTIPAMLSSSAVP